MSLRHPVQYTCESLIEGLPWGLINFNEWLLKEDSDPPLTIADVSKLLFFFTVYDLERKSAIAREKEI